MNLDVMPGIMGRHHDNLKTVNSDISQSSNGRANLKTRIVCLRLHCVWERDSDLVVPEDQGKCHILKSSEFQRNN